MLGLRTADGIDLREFRTRYGVDLRQNNEPLVARLVNDGLLRIEGDRLLPTLAGLAVTDSLARDFEIGPETAGGSPIAS